jgi:serine/threonine protein kinase/tetratricopeptide (TPR) repeat protein
MATVFRAVDRQTGRDVALKLLAASANDEGGRFAREARVLAELTHPGIVRYVAHGVTPDGLCYLAMEWLEGETLRQRLERKALTLSESVALVAALAGALAEAHARGVVHRDLKPSNVFLPGCDPTAAKLLDFGIAHLSRGTRAATRTGMMLGTPGYMAPEQARGDKGIDARADVFALGTILFECVAGRPTFLGEHPMALLAKILIEEPPRLRAVRPDAPRAIESLVARMLAKDPAARPADASAVLAELEAIGPLEGSDATPDPQRDTSLTRGEQRLLTVVLAGRTRRHVASSTVGAEDEDNTAIVAPRRRHAPPTPGSTSSGLRAALLEHTRDDDLLVALRAAASPFGGRLEMLAEGSVVWTLAGSGVATDQARQAARCALALRQVLTTEAPIALATGRAIVDEAGSAGEVIDRAARLLAGAPAARAVRLDETTAGLLDLRFEVTRDTRGLVLVGERLEMPPTRTLLGKPTPCVGRDRELATLMAAYQESAHEPVARVVLVTAPPGTGKSRLRHELLRRMSETDEPPEVWMGRGDPMKAGSPYAILAPALRRAAAVVDGEPPHLRQRKLRARVSRYVRSDDVARIAVFLGELVGVPFNEDDYPPLRAARSDPQLMGDQIRRAFVDFLDAEAREHPLVLVLEDLHWGDLLSVRLVDAALRALGERPLFVLALARPEVHDAFPRLWAERHVEELRLGPLTRRAAEKLIREVLGPDADPSVVERLIATADGNAFFLEELIRAVREGGGEALPDTVVAMVQARLEKLEPDARRVLRAASIFGEVFWRDGVAALLGDSEISRAHLDEWLEALVDRELVTKRVESRFAGEVELVFRHGLVREAAYAMLTAEDKLLGHRLAAEFLERVGESDSMSLAEHYERGGEPHRAIAWYKRAAQQALEGNDLEGALARAHHGIAGAKPGPLRGELHLIVCEAHQWRGEYAESVHAAKEAVADLPRGSATWCSAMGLGAQAASKTSDHAWLHQIGEELLALLPSEKATVESSPFDAPPPDDGNDQLFWMVSDVSLGGVEADIMAGLRAEAPLVVAAARTTSQLYLHGKAPLANALVEKIAPLHDRYRSAPEVLAWLDDACAVRALYSGDLGGYLTKKEEVVRCCGATGQQRLETLQRVRLGYACLEIGDYGRAVKELRAALAQAEAMGLHQATALAHHNLGLALARQGKLVEARALEEEAVREFAAQGDGRLEMASRIYLAEILILAGDLPAADAMLKSLITDAGDGSSPTKAYALACLARTRVRQGLADEAMTHAQAAMAMLEEMGGVDEGEAMIRLAHVEGLLGVGRDDEAKAALTRARDRLLDRAALIRSPELRASFLERVPENARTLALASAHLR